MKTHLLVFAFCAALSSSMADDPFAAEPSDTRSPKDIYPRWTVVGEWKATHPNWTDTITFKEDGTFSTGNQKTRGHWVLTADTGTPLLVLRWTGWGTESLLMVSQDQFRGQINPGSFMDMRRETAKSGAKQAAVQENTAAYWEAMKRSQAQIEVVNMQPIALVADNDQKGWTTVPSQLTKNAAVIYMPAGTTNGVADVKVTAKGFLMLACNYDYQGNASGNWQQDVWDESKFESEGWHHMSETELGGVLVKGDNRAQIIFSKHVDKGETFRIRCNKHDPPFPILLAPK
jgi:hypothetical protein